MSNIGQIMAECGCQHSQCKTMGYCMAARIIERGGGPAVVVNISSVSRAEVSDVVLEFDWDIDVSDATAASRRGRCRTVRTHAASHREAATHRAPGRIGPRPRRGPCPSRRSV